MGRFRRTNRFLRVAALTFGLTGTVLAQAPSDRDRQAITIAEQKAESDVTGAILEADKLAATSRDKAVQRVKQALTNLDLSILLTTQKRSELTTRLQNAIASYEGKATIVLPAAMAAKSAAEAKAAMEKARIETDEVTKGLRAASTAMDAGRTGDAAAVIAMLVAKYPNNPALQGLRGANLTAANLSAWNKIQDEYAAAWVADQMNVASAAIPTTDDIKFPNADKWRKITELRKNANKVKLTPKEQSILDSLNTTVTVIVRDRPFQEALQEFSNQIKQEIFVDTKSLEDLGLDLNRKMNFNGSVTARTALRALLQGQGLTFVVKDEMIQVVTIEKAEREMLTAKSYDVSDLVDTGGPFSNAVVWGPQLSYQQTTQNADAVVALIKESIDPKCWKDKGGFCSITFHLPTKSIVVRASTEVHAALGGSILKK